MARVAVEETVRHLAGLLPGFAIPGYGNPISGNDLRDHLDLLQSHCAVVAVRDQGRYVGPPH